MDQNRLLSLFLVLFLFSSCQEEPQTPVFDKEYLYGRWELTDAWRNKKKTEMLVGTFYEFDREGTVRTNFNQEMVEKDFEYDFDGKMVTLKSKTESQLNIDSLSESTLIFNVLLHDFNFKMALGKKQESEEEKEL